MWNPFRFEDQIYLYIFESKTNINVKNVIAEGSKQSAQSWNLMPINKSDQP